MPSKQHVPTDQAAPERVWVSEGSGFEGQDILIAETSSDPYEDGSFTGVEYIRADLAAPSAPAEVEGLVITDEMVEDGLAYYSEGGCCGLDSNERRDVVRAILEAAVPTALTALQAENERLLGEIEELQGAQILNRTAIRLMKARAEKAEAERDAWKTNAEALDGAVAALLNSAHDYQSGIEEGRETRAAHEKLREEV